MEMRALSKTDVARRRADDALIRGAIKVLEERVAYGKKILLSSPGPVRNYLRLTMTGLEQEIFAVLWLDARNRLIEREVLFRGTLTQTSV
jgi:DNA repair protein RadC